MLTLNRDSQEPIYQQIKRHLRSQIETGTLAPGDRLPPTRDLAEQLGLADAPRGLEAVHLRHQQIH